MIMSRNFFCQNEELHRGDYMISNNGQYKAIFQDDSNFVLYTWKPIWASNTCGSGATRLRMQSDCNLVLYADDHTVKWHANCPRSGENLCRVQVTDDGRLVVTKENEQLWSAGK